MIPKYPVYFFTLFLSSTLSNLIIRPIPCISPSDRQCPPSTRVPYSHTTPASPDNHPQAGQSSRQVMSIFTERQPVIHTPLLGLLVPSHSRAHKILNTQIACKQMRMRGRECRSGWVGGWSPSSQDQAGSGRSFLLLLVSQNYKLTRSKTVFFPSFFFFTFRGLTG